MERSGAILCTHFHLVWFCISNKYVQSLLKLKGFFFINFWCFLNK